MNRIQPSSTLFPYTTLFRSKRREQTAPEVQAIFFRRRHQPRRPPPAKIRPGNPAPAMGPGTVEVTDQVPGEKMLRAVSDRKSTRLNSSHLGISYAVFCLKKK